MPGAREGGREGPKATVTAATGTKAAMRRQLLDHVARFSFSVGGKKERPSNNDPRRRAKERGGWRRRKSGSSSIVADDDDDGDVDLPPDIGQQGEQGTDSPQNFIFR